MLKPSIKHYAYFTLIQPAEHLKDHFTQIPEKHTFKLISNGMQTLLVLFSTDFEMSVSKISSPTLIEFK